MSDVTSIAILAGGRSKRLGTDKALVRLTDDGPTLLERVVDAVRSSTDDLFIVTAPRPEYEAIGVTQRPDLYPNAGVLGGIASALRHAEHDRCLVVSCDHPFLSPSLIRAMLQVTGDWDLLVPVLPGESRQGGRSIRQTLHAIYRKTCLPAIERKLADDQLQIVGFFGDVAVRELDLEWLSTHDPELRSFFSVNTPEALEAARALVRDRRDQA